MVRYLLEKGAHPGLRSNTGWTAAHFAAESGRTHILRFANHIITSDEARCGSTEKF